MTEAIKERVAILRSNPVAPDPRVEKLARTLLADGRLVLILAWDRTGKLPTREEVTSIGSLYRLRLRARYGSGIRNLPLLLIWQLFLLYSLISRRRRYDVIHACDFDTVLPAILVGRLLGKAVIFDIFDMYSDSVRATPGLLLKLIRQMEIFAINRASAVILADDSRRQQIAGSRPNKLIVVYNSPASVAVEGLDRLPPVDSFRLVYVGLLVRQRSLEEVIEIVGHHPTWRLDLAGFGGDQAEILDLARKYENLSFHGRVDYEKALAMTAAADAVFAIYDPGVPNHRYSSPNKVFEAMMLGKPLVVAHGTNMDKIVETHGCGLVVDYGDAEQIEAALSRLADDPDLRERLGQAGKRAYVGHFSWPLMAERITQLYFEL